jgi:protein-S-isoprenylcysteine O-methyltransferase Ste14
MAAGLAAQRALPGRGRSLLRTALAGGLVGASGTLAFASERSFRRKGTTVLPFHPEQSSALVTTGANAVSRNPMYVGMAGLLLAHAMHRGSWSALVPAAAFVAFVDGYQVRFEERALRETFGEEYDAYCAAVPRWLDQRSTSALRDAFAR